MNESGLWVVHSRNLRGALRDSVISTISDYFKGFVLKWEKNMCSLKKLAHKVDGKQKTLNHQDIRNSEEGSSSEY